MKKTFAPALCAILFVLTPAPLLRGEQLAGTVSSSSPGTARISIEGNALPNVGDAARIFFKLPGSDDEVFVGGGKVTEVAGDIATVKLDDSSVVPQKDQLVRITSAHPTKKSSVAAASSAVVPTPAESPAASSSSRSPNIAKSTPAPAAPPTDGSTDPHFIAGTAAVNRGDDKAAIPELTKAIRSVPGYWASYHNRGMAYAHLGQWKHALQDYQKAAQLNPSHAETRYSTGVCLQNLNDFKRAIEAYTECLRLDPQNASALCNRGAAYLSLKQGQRALVDLDKAIELAPDVAFAWQNRGSVYRLLGQPARAIQDYDQAIRLDPKFKQAIDNRALALGELGNAAPPPASADGKAGKLIGKWQSGRHVTQYFADGTYILDPDLTPQPIRQSVSRWRIEGNRLITSDAAGTHTYTIVSLTARELVTKDEQGRTYREKRL